MGRKGIDVRSDIVSVRQVRGRGKGMDWDEWVGRIARVLFFIHWQSRCMSQGRHEQGRAACLELRTGFDPFGPVLNSLGE